MSDTGTHVGVFTRKIVQLAATDPGWEVCVLYNTDEMWRWFYKYDAATGRQERVWELVETP